MKIVQQDTDENGIFCLRIKLADGTLLELLECSETGIVMSNVTNTSFNLALYIDGKTFSKPVTIEG